MSETLSSNVDRLQACSACDSVEIRFGNSIFPLQSSELDTLRSILRERIRSERPDGVSTAEHTVIWLGEEGIGARFSRDESRRLLQLLDEAAYALRADRATAELARERSAEGATGASVGLRAPTAASTRGLCS